MWHLDCYCNGGGVLTTLSLLHERDPRPSLLLRPAVTIVSVLLMGVLVLSELLMYIKVDTTSHMAVADVHEHDVVTARLHATFPFVECKGEVESIKLT